jgi:UDP-glucuronate decarboxylase
MKILVTGGAGFIGSHLCQRLLDEGNQVICLDNFLTGRQGNIEPFLGDKNFALVEHDIIEPFLLDGDFNQIYNLACPASPVHYQKNAIRTIKASTSGMINVLGFARKHSARILQASTSEVYGDPEVHPQPENYYGNVSPIGPRACYDEGKRVAETLMFDYHRAHGIEIRVARIFNTYGPRMMPDDGRVISNFIVQALNNEDITVYGDGGQTRSFCYVADLVDGLIKLMNSNELGPINLGNPDFELTIRQLADKIISMTGSKSEIVFKDLPKDDPKQRKPDITKAVELLGWRPIVSVEEGLIKTIKSFKEVKL